MTKESLDDLEYLRFKRSCLKEELGKTEMFIRTMRNICDHKYSDGTSALSHDSDGAWCSICEKKV